MRRVIPLVLCVVLFSSPVRTAEPAAVPTAVPDLETPLHIAAHYLDEVLEHTLSSLDLIGSTPAAQRGEWQAIKPYLQKLAATVPGVYFYVLPDGNYYSLTLDYTNLNLRDRGYFESLFQGNPVRGFPIYSRSSGKRSALMAAPIRTGDRVSGALGASVFLDELHERLNRVFAFPPRLQVVRPGRRGADHAQPRRRVHFPERPDPGKPFPPRGDSGGVRR
jgi:hypothetical protein